MKNFKLYRSGGKLGQAMYFGSMCTKDGEIAREILKCTKIGRKAWVAWVIYCKRNEKGSA